MQDFPHGLPPDASVGFTVINQVRPAHLQTLTSHNTVGITAMAQIRALAYVITHACLGKLVMCIVSNGQAHLAMKRGPLTPPFDHICLLHSCHTSWGYSAAGVGCIQSRQELSS